MRFWSVRDSERYPWEFLIFSPSGTNICLTLVYLPGRITVSPPPPIPLPDAAEQELLKVFPSGRGRTFERATRPAPTFRTQHLP